MYDLHAVVIKKVIPIEEARKISQDIIKNKNRKFMRETQQSYRFRNIPKQKFIKGSFRSKRVNNYITLIYGNLI